MEEKETYSFEHEGSTYTNNFNGYYWRDGKRISKKVWNDARYEHMQQVNRRLARALEDEDILYETHHEVKEDINHPDMEEEKVNKIEVDGHEYVNDWEHERFLCDGEEISKAEFDAAMGIDRKPEKKRTRKPQRSKDVAFEHDGKTITAKQERFLEAMQKCTNWTGTGIWTDMLNVEIGGEFAGKPMSIGAMISTLREKGLAEVQVEEREDGGRTRKVKYFFLTLEGQEFLTALNDSMKGGE